MGIGVGLLLIAVGAILAFAVDAQVQGVDVQVVGWILMIIGLLGILLDLMLWQSWRGGYRRAAYVEGLCGAQEPLLLGAGRQRGLEGEGVGQVNLAVDPHRP